MTDTAAPLPLPPEDDAFHFAVRGSLRLPGFLRRLIENDDRDHPAPPVTIVSMMLISEGALPENTDMSDIPLGKRLVVYFNPAAYDGGLKLGTVANGRVVAEFISPFVLVITPNPEGILGPYETEVLGDRRQGAGELIDRKRIVGEVVDRDAAPITTTGEVLIDEGQDVPDAPPVPDAGSFRAAAARAG